MRLTGSSVVQPPRGDEHGNDEHARGAEGDPNEDEQRHGTHSFPSNSNTSRITITSPTPPPPT